MISPTPDVASLVSPERVASEREAAGARPELVLAGLLVLMNAYRCTACPKLAGCVANHLRTLAGHPGADPVLRELSGRMESDWRRLAASPSSPCADIQARNGLRHFFSARCS